MGLPAVQGDIAVLTRGPDVKVVTLVGVPPLFVCDLPVVLEGRGYPLWALDPLGKTSVLIADGAPVLFVGARVRDIEGYVGVISRGVAVGVFCDWR